jgi:hypothetical protein
VEVAREFVRKQSKPVSNVTNGRNSDHHLHIQVAAFLAWPKERVSHALAQLVAFEPDEETKEPTLSREAVEHLPTIHAATTLHREVRTAARLGRKITEREQVDSKIFFLRPRCNQSGDRTDRFMNLDLGPHVQRLGVLNQRFQTELRDFPSQ